MAGLLSDMTYAAQFEVLRVWIGTLEPGELSSPSALAGWTVADLVGHLAAVGQTISALQPMDPADPAAEPMSLSTYVSNYAPSVGQVRQIAMDTTVQAGERLLDALDQAHAEALSALDHLGASDRVVMTRRGPILLSDFLDTRLIELVVHSGDLARSLPDRPAPMVMPSASRRVVVVMRELLTEHADNPAEALAAASAMPAAEFIELSAGRRRPPDGLAPALAKALPLF